MEKKCKVCSHDWISIKPDPVVCPKCKSYNWKTGNKINKGEL